MKKYRVIKNQHVLCKEESNPNGEWPNWIYCETKDNEGWIPKSIIRRKSDLGVMEEDYDAKEFDIKKDEVIVMSKSLNGWIWGHKEEAPGIYAWAPLNHLEEIE